MSKQPVNISPRASTVASESRSDASPDCAMKDEIPFPTFQDDLYPEAVKSPTRNKVPHPSSSLVFLFNKSVRWQDLDGKTPTKASNLRSSKERPNIGYYTTESNRTETSTPERRTKIEESSTTPTLTASTPAATRKPGRHNDERRQFDRKSCGMEVFNISLIAHASANIGSFDTMLSSGTSLGECMSHQAGPEKRFDDSTNRLIESNQYSMAWLCSDAWRSNSSYRKAECSNSLETRVHMKSCLACWTVTIGGEIDSILVQRHTSFRILAPEPWFVDKLMPCQVRPRSHDPRCLKIKKIKIRTRRVRRCCWSRLPIGTISFLSLAQGCLHD
jgi:hypothetical protein